MKVRFACPLCEQPAQVTLPGSAEWQCPGCDHLLTLSECPSPLYSGERGGGEGAGVSQHNPLTPDPGSPEYRGRGEQSLSACAVCGNMELYKKKDFPHWLGMTILLVACFGSIIPYYQYHQWAVWAILIGSAVVDGLLYLWVGDVVVCYRCNAHHRGVLSTAAFPPFEQGIAERYRQERIRREQLQAAKRS